MSRSWGPALGLFLVLLLPPGCGGLPAIDDPREEVCGDGIIDGAEQCDDGPINLDTGSCTTLCRRARCGDGLIGPGETCDDANDVPDDDCDACHSAFDATWFAWLAGAESVCVSPDGSLFAAGELVPTGEVGARAVAVLDGTTGEVTFGDGWAELHEPDVWQRSALAIACPPAGGAVLATDIRHGEDPPVALAAWVEPGGALRLGYQSASLAGTYHVGAAGFAPSGPAVLAGSLGDHAWALVHDGEQMIWEGEYTASGQLSVTAIDLDDSLQAAMVGVRAPQGDPFIALDRGAANLAWSAITPQEGDTFDDVRFGPGELWVVHTWHEGGTTSSLEHRALSDGQVTSSTPLAVPANLELQGARLLPDGRVLTWGRRPTSRWLALHAPDGSVAWRANARQLSADLLDAASADGNWIYAIIAGVAVAAWHIGD